MKIWKPLTKYKKFREEFAYHTDLRLDEGECFVIDFNGYGVKECVPKNKIWKIHCEIAVEPFEDGHIEEMKEIVEKIKPFKGKPRSKANKIWQKIKNFIK